MVIHGLKWYCLLVGGDQNVSLRDLYPILFFSYFVNQFAPLRPGAPLRGVLGSRKFTIPLSLSLLAILIEQGLDVLITGTLALPSISILSSRGISMDTRVIALMIIGAVCLLIMFILWWDSFVRIVSKILMKALPNSLSTQLSESKMSPVGSINLFYILGSFLLTIIYWAIRFELFIVILRIGNISIGFATAATIISVSFLVSVLSMVPGGWGVKELTITVLLVGLGINEQLATAAAFLDRAVLLVFIFIIGSISSVIIGTDIRKLNQYNDNNQKNHVKEN